MILDQHSKTMGSKDMYDDEKAQKFINDIKLWRERFSQWTLGQWVGWVAMMGFHCLTAIAFYGM